MYYQIIKSMDTKETLPLMKKPLANSNSGTENAPANNSGSGGKSNSNGS
jgi:hypothetical protein